MIKTKPTELTAGSSDDEALPTTNVGTDWDAVERIDSAVSRLQREGSSNRVDRIESIAGVADRVEDITPAQANLLAAYLLTTKSGTEHDRVLEHLPKFRRWSRLYLALADGLYRTTMQRDQLQLLLSKMLDEDVTLGDGPAGREAVRGTLLRRAFVHVGPGSIYHTCNPVTELE